MMPEVNGFDLCRDLRARDPHVPIMMLSAKSDIVDQGRRVRRRLRRLRGKALQQQELAMRIEALLRRAGWPTRGASRAGAVRWVRLGDMEIRLKRNEVLVHGRYVNLTPKEFQIIAFLANHVGEVFSAQDIMANVWGRGLSARVGEHRRVRAQDSQQR